MPFTTAQIAIGANYSLETYRRNNPIDQINRERPFLKWLMDRKKPVIYGNGFHNEAVFINNDSNYQNYFGPDQVTYNERDPVRQAKFSYANYHDGFWFDEDRLAANGIILTDDREAVATGAEKIQLVNLLDVSYTALKESINDGLARELLLNGTQNSKAVAGLDALVSTTPTTGTVGGIDASTATYWRNNVSLGIVDANLIEQMEQMWRACTLYGGMVPDTIVVGAAFMDKYRQQAGVTINREIHAPGNMRGGVSLDASTTGLYFKGVELVWDPTFEALDAELGVIAEPWTKRAYFLNSKTITFRPFQGRWMVDRKPERLPDRYVHYFAQTSAYGLTINKRNANAVLSID